MAQQLFVALARHAVEHHPGQAHPWWTVVAEAPHQRRQGTGLARGLHHQHHRQVQQ
jgi:hypothetical protein